MIIIDKPLALIRELQAIRACRILTIDESNVIDEVIDLVKGYMNSYQYVELER